MRTCAWLVPAVLALSVLTVPSASGANFAFYFGFGTCD